jgi:hypothetical protein
LHDDDLGLIGYQPPDIGISPIADMDAHQTIVTARWRRRAAPRAEEG